MSNQDTIYLKNIHIKSTDIKDDTLKIRGQLDTIIAQGGGGGGGSTGLSLESTQLEVLAGITSGFDLLHSDLTSQLTVNLVDVSGLATQTTLSDTYNLLNDNIGTGGLSVSITALDGEKITNSVVDTKRGLDVNIINSVGITGNVSVSNFPTSFEVSNFPAEQGITGSVSVSNFPLEQGITGSVSVLNFPTSFEVSNFPAEQGITGSVSVSNFPLEQGITGSVSVLNFPNTQAVSIDQYLNVNILNTNSTIYDLTDNSPTLTGNDSRYEADRNRPDSWLYSNTKSQGGSSLYWYANSTTSPQGAQEFNITKEMIDTLYSVVSINKTANNDALPIMGLYSPSNTGFYTSRWVYTIDPSELLLQNEKILIYYGTNPIDLYPNLRHIQLLFNASASQGSLLPTEIIYLMSLNAPSAMAAGAISYNVYNTGFVLNNGIQNQYQFTSGIKSKGDLALSKLTVDNGVLGVSVSNVVGVVNTNLDTMTFTSDQLNVNVGQVTFSVIDDKGTKGLNIINYNMYAPVIITFTQANVNSITGKSDAIDLRGFKIINIIATETHSGGGSHNVNVEYSTDNSTWFVSPNVITGTATSFSWDYSGFCVPYMRLSFNVPILTLNCYICLK